MVIDSIHMNLSTNSSKQVLLEPSSPKSRKEYKVASGITKETLNELEHQQSHRQTNGHGSEMMRYLQDTNASEAFAVGEGIQQGNRNNGETESLGSSV